MQSSFFELIKKRRSIRKFTEQPVEIEKKELLAKAALMAPTSKSSNPWHFVFVEDKEMLKKLSLSRPHGSQLLSGATLAIVVVADSSKSDVWVEDAAIASTFIQLQAENLGLGSCWVQVRNRMKDENISTEDEIKLLLSIPKDYKILNMIAIGYKVEEKSSHQEDKLLYERIHSEFYSTKET